MTERAYAPRHHPSGGPHRRHVTAKPKKTAPVLKPDHAAIIEHRTLFPSTRRFAEETGRILKSGMNQRKLGATVLKGRWRGMPIYALTLEERATCPSTCAMWNGCYGNSMHFAERVVHDADFEDILWLELAGYNALYPEGFVVRLHVLGDFYSVDYVKMWQRALEVFPALNVFGFSARQASDPIGAVLRATAERIGSRFAVRWSGETGPMGAVTIGRDEATEITVCPAQQREDRFCGNCGLCPLYAENQSGMCKLCWVKVKNAARAKPIPDDFRETAGTLTNDEAVERWGAPIWTIGRWRSVTGIRAARQCEGGCVPEDFAGRAEGLTVTQLGEHYRRTGETIRRWCRLSGVVPIDGRALGLHRRRAVTTSDRVLGSVRVMDIRDGSAAGQAADYLRRFGPVVRCNSGGRYDPLGDHYRRGSVVLTRDEIMDRARRNGWDPDEWRRVA